MSQAIQPEPKEKKDETVVVEEPKTKQKKAECGIGFLQRDQTIKNQEEAGIYEFRLIRNDKTHENMKYLIDLKNIFSKQLPKMPKEYIVKLVFD